MRTVHHYVGFYYLDCAQIGGRSCMIKFLELGDESME